MSVKSTVISSFSKFILGGTVFAKIRDIVALYNTKDLSGTEKKAGAIKDLEDIGLGVANWALNLGIELAVAYFKALSGM